MTLVEDEARFVAYQPVSRSEHSPRESDTVVPKSCRCCSASVCGLIASMQVVRELHNAVNRVELRYWTLPAMNALPERPSGRWPPLYR
uniref:Uncharacterized protein n=1 Tax=Mycobacterium riyadhense TaxID=486698 RepID=A0A653EI56_9MYCO|nr:hypothetical protein BIN_B_01974 [Mycobacterium riyadhense]